MKPVRLFSSFALACFCSSLSAGPVAAANHATASSHAVAENENSAEVPRASLPAVETKVVQYRERDIVRVKTKLRFSTLIVLPKNEEILDFICGDKEYWAINGIQNFAHR